MMEATNNNIEPSQMGLSKDYKALYHDACTIIEQARKQAYRAINVSLTLRNWLLGERIAKEELDGAKRAKYGKGIIKILVKELSFKYGKGFDFSSLYQYIRFYRLFPEILDAVNPKSSTTNSKQLLPKILDAVRPQLLPWTHYRELIRVENADARKWYEQEALREMWSTRTLHRNISSQYYFRFDHLKRTEGDNPTIGLLLCEDTSNDIARYSVLHGSEQLFQVKYMPYLPTKEELRHEIEMQKEIFRQQQMDSMKDSNNGLINS